MPPPRQGLAKGSLGPPQLKKLEEFGALLKAGMLGAVRADQADLALEGEFWLVEIQGEAFPAPASMALATDVFEEGYLIVKVKWYELVDKERRDYRLLPTARHIVVNAMIFLPGLEFGGSPRLRQATGLSVLSQETQNYIMDAV